MTSAPLPADLQQLQDAARDAWLYTLPLIEMATTRSRAAARGARLNTLYHVHKLADHRAREVTTPNNDTLYSTVQLDLSQGPVTLTLPATGERYLSVALMDAYTNNFAILGSRTTGPDGGAFLLLGPQEASPVVQAQAPTIVRAPTNMVWALARLLVDGPEDMAAAKAVQAGLSLQGPDLGLAPAYAPRTADWQDYFASADALLAANPPPATDLGLLRKIAVLGLGSGHFDGRQFSPQAGAAIAAGVAAARTILRGGGALGGTLSGTLSGTTAVNGWTYPKATLGDFGQDYTYRAGVALTGLAALPPAEAMYMGAVNPLGGAFAGTSNWRLHFAAGQQLPVHSFWSLSLYEATPEGQFFFTQNALDRYAIGDRTPGLVYGEDGSLDLWIGHTNPGAAHENNWLPAPSGQFVLCMRAYLPKAELLDGSYRLPPIQLLDA